MSGWFDIVVWKIGFCLGVYFRIVVILSINNILSTLTSSKLETPYFLEAQYREVMPALGEGRVDFSQKTYFAGFSIGI